MGLEENSYSRLKCPECRFEGDRDVTAKLNIRRRALKILELPREAPTPPTPKADVAPNRWGDLPALEGEPSPPSKGEEEVSRERCSFNPLLNYSLVRVPGCPSGLRGRAGDPLSHRGRAGSNPAPGARLY